MPDDAHHFGHTVYLSDENGRLVLRYRDTGELVPAGSSQRSCPRCGKMPTDEGHDPCLGRLPGVAHACCGHGVAPGVVVFETGHSITGEFDEMTLNHGVIGRIRGKLRGE